MLQKINMRWALLLTANVAMWCVLSFYESTTAAPKGARQPFANAVEQRAEMVRQLEDITALLKEQNALLRGGKLQVNVTSSDASRPR